jgi:rRNA maturation protein Rpf1
MSVYKGRCACCGAGKKHKRMQEYPRAYPIPPGFAGSLPHQSGVNNRLCKQCHKNHFVAPVEARQIGPVGSPAVRVVTPRKRAAPSPEPIALDRALANRSRSAKGAAADALAKLPNTHNWQTSNILAILMQLHCQEEIDEPFGRLRVCGGTLDLRKTAFEAQQMKIQLVCRDCGAVTEYCSNDDGGKIELTIGEEKLTAYKNDIRDVLLVLLAGSTYTTYQILRSAEGVMAESTFYRIQKFVAQGLVDCCQAVLKQQRQAFAAKLEESGSEWVASMNGAWSHRGWTARQHSFVIRAKDQNKIVCAVVLTKKHVAMVKGPDGSTREATVHEGNYFGTSKGMEGEAFIKAIAELRADDLLKRLSHITTDGDSSIPKIIVNTPELTNIRTSLDPGHVQKNFMRSLQDVFSKTAKYKGFPYRIGKFFMRCLKRAEAKFVGHDDDVVKKRKAYFDKMWAHTYDHYTRLECPKSCPCNEFYRGEQENIDDGDIFAAHALASLVDVEIDEDGDAEVEAEVGDEIVREILEDDADENVDGVKMRREPKRWLDTANNSKEADFAVKMKPLINLAGESATDVLFGLNTCLAECSHSRRLVFCRKDRFYYSSYEARSVLSAALENVSRAELYERIFQHFNLLFDQRDDKVLEVLEQQDNKKVRDSTRKRSLDFKTRQSQISKSRIEENIAAAEASQTRRDERGYTKLASKKLKTSVFAKSRGPKSQADLKEMMDKGFGNVNECPKCAKLYTKTHKCRTSAVPPKKQVRAKAAALKVQKLPPKEKDEASDEPLPDEEPVEVLSEEPSDNSLGQRKKPRDDDEFMAPVASCAIGNAMESVSIEEDELPKKRRRAKKKLTKRRR